MYKAIINIVKKEILYMIRSPKAIFFELILPIVNFIPILLTVWFLVETNGSEHLHQSIGTTYVNNYYIVVLISFVFINMAEASGCLLETELYLGTFEQILMTPTNATTLVKGWYLFSLFKSFVYILIFIIFSIFLVDITIINIPLLLILMVIMLILALALGVIVQAITMYMKQSDTIIATLVGLVPILSCISYPIDVLPYWLKIISQLLPTTYLFDLLKYSFSKSSLIFSLEKELLILIITSIIFIIFSLNFYRLLFRRVKKCGITMM